LSIVPRPGVCRKGIHSNNTPILTRKFAHPILRPVTRLIPSANTTQGLTPAPAAINSASPIPKSINPKHNRKTVLASGRKLSGPLELQDTVGTAFTDKKFMCGFLKIPGTGFIHHQLVKSNSNLTHKVANSKTSNQHSVCS